MHVFLKHEIISKINSYTFKSKILKKKYLFQKNGMKFNISLIKRYHVVGLLKKIITKNLVKTYKKTKFAVILH